MNLYKVLLFTAFCLLPFFLKAQDCGFNPQAQISNVSCSGNSGGAISLELSCSGGDVGNCYTETPVPEESYESCDVTQSSSGDINLSSGQTACIPQGVDITVNNLNLNNGKLVISGKALLNYANLGNYDQIVILKTGVVEFNNINFNSQQAKVVNYGTVTFKGSSALFGQVDNYGQLTVNGDLNINSGGGVLKNFGSIQVNQTLNNSKTILNYGTIRTTANLENNSGGLFKNYCTVICKGQFLNDGAAIYENHKYTEVTNTATLNGSSITKMFGGSEFRTTHLVLNTASAVNTETSCSKFSVSGNTTLNGGFSASGPVFLCDQNGIEIDNSTQSTFTGGAAVSCSCDLTGGSSVSADFHWSDGTTGNSITNLSAGDYFVEITCNGCVDTIPYTITEPAPLTASASESLSVPGKMNLSVAGGTGNYTYKWINSSGDQVSVVREPESLTPGTYTVTVTDGNECVTSTSASISEPDCELKVDYDIDQPTCSKGNDGRIKLTVPDCDYSSDSSNSGSQNCYSEVPEETQDLNNCDQSVTSDGDINLFQGGKACIAEGDSVNVNSLNLNGGTLVVGGAANISYANLNGTDKIVVLKGARVYFTFFNYNSTTPVIENFGYVELREYHAVLGSFTNYGDVWARKDFNINSSGGRVYNYGKIDVNLTFNNSYTLENYGTLNTSGQFENNSGGSFQNYCTLNVSGNLLNNNGSTLENHGSIEVVLETTVNGQSQTVLHPASSWITGDAMLDHATISNPGSGCASFKVSGQTVVNSVFIATGNVDICDENGIEQDYSNGQAFINGATTDCSCSNTGSGSGSGTTASFDWSTEATGPILENVSPGVYNVTVTCNGCSKDLEIVVDSTNFEVELFPTDTKCFEGKNGKITALITNSNPNLVYEWSDSVTTLNRTNLAAGTYSLTVRDTVTDCEVTRTAVINDAAPLALDLNGKNASCKTGQDGRVWVESLIGGEGKYSYLWSNGDTYSQSTGLTAGEYKLTVSDENGCEVRDSIVISAPEVPCTPDPCLNYTVSANPTDPLCAEGSGSVEAVVENGTAPFSYDWSDNAATTSEITGLEAGNYSVIVTDSEGCIDTAYAAVQKPSVPEFTIIVNDANCTGASTGSATIVPVDGTTNYSYSWTGGETGTSIYGKSAGSYSVDISYGSGCVLDTFVVISEKDTACGECGEFSPSADDPTDVTCAGNQNGSITVTVPNATGTVTYYWPHDEMLTGATASGLSGGVYTVVVSDEKCSDDVTAFVGEPDSLKLIAVGGDVSCAGKNDGVAGVIPVGGNGGYTYSWSNGETSRIVKDLSADTYTVTVTDSKGCIADTSVVVNSSTLPCIKEPTDSCKYLSVELKLTSVVKCNQGKTAGLDAVVSGAKGKVTALWSDQTTGLSRRNLGADLYSITITDDSTGCQATDQKAVTEPSPLALDLNGTDAGCKTGQDGKVWVESLTGGVGKYSYLWSNGDTYSQSTGLAAGEYKLTVSDENGCEVRDSIVISAPEVPCTPDPCLNYTVSANPTDPLCAEGSGSVEAVVENGTGPFSYDWSDNAATTSEITGLEAGNYSVIVTDSEGCIDTAYAAVQKPSVPEFTIIVNDANCSGASTGSATIIPVDRATNYSYSWTGGETGTSIYGKSAGSYSVDISYGSGCVLDTFVVISEKDTACGECGEFSPSAEEPTDVFCAGNQNGSITVTVPNATGSVTYYWPHDETLTGATASGLSGGVYTVVVSDEKCSDDVTAFVGEPDSLKLIAVGGDVSCAGKNDGVAGVIPVGGNGGYTYSWSNGETSRIIKDLSADTYTVTVTDSKDCIADTAVVVNSSTLPCVKEPSDSCKYLSVDLKLTSVVKCNQGKTAGLDAVVSGAKGKVTALWSDQTTGLSRRNLGADLYSITITDDSTGCQATDQKAVTEPSPLALDLNGIDAGCKTGQDGKVWVESLTGGVGKYSYLWSNGDTYSQSTGLSAGEYKLTVSDENGCEVRDSIVISAPEVPCTPDPCLNYTVSAEPTDPLCAEGSGSVKAVVENGTAPFSYDWSDNAATTSEITGLEAGNYSVIVTDSEGCIDTAYAAVQKPSVPEFTVIVNDANCTGASTGSATIVPVDGTTNYSYSWAGGETGTSIYGKSAGSYSVDISYGSGCVLDTFVVISEKDTACGECEAFSPSADDPTDVTCAGNQNGSITVTVPNTTGTVTYYWPHDETLTGATASGLSGGVYTVVVSDEKCSDDVTAFVGEPDSLKLIAVGGDVSCAGKNDGVAGVIPVGGNGGYTYSWSNGETSRIIKDLSADTYTVTVTDSKDCIADTSVVIGAKSEECIVDCDNLEITLDNSTPVSCPGKNNGSLTVSISDLPTQPEFSWTGPEGYSASGSTISNLKSGSYIATAQFENCSVKDTFRLVADTSEFNLVLDSIRNSSCLEGKDGGIFISSISDDVSYTWSYQEIASEDLTGVSAGFYYVIGENASGCRDSLGATIEPGTGECGPCAAFSAAPEIYHVSCTDQEDGYVKINATGGSGSYTYSWTGLSFTGDVATDLAADSYTFSVEDNELGCSATGVAEVKEPKLDIDYDIENPTCKGDQDGKIVINDISFTSLDGEKGYSECFEGTSPYSCTGCDLEINTSENIAINGGETVCLTASAYSGEITLNSGTLIICGDATPTAFTFNGGAVIINGSLTLPEISGSGTIENYGTLTVNGDANFHEGTWVTNNNLIDINGSYNNYQLTENRGTIKAAAVITGENSEFNNRCTVDITGSFVNNGHTFNTGSITVGGLLTNNESGQIDLDQGSEFTAANLENNAQIAGTGAFCGYLEITGSTNQNQGGALSGNISFCGTFADADGSIEESVNTTDCKACNSCTVTWKDGATGRVRENLSAGKYIATFDCHGCSVDRTFEIKDLDVETDPEPISCAGSDNGKLTALVEGGSKPYTYSWTGPENFTSSDSVITSLKPGLYLVSVTDTNNCTPVTALYEMTEPLPLALDTVTSGISCQGRQDGTATVTPTGGTAPYTYNWNDPEEQTTAVANNLAPGSYQVTVTDANGCSESISVTINNSQADCIKCIGFGIEADPIHVSCLGGSDGSASIDIEGGQEPFSIDWHGADPDKLSAGSYTVTVTDVNKCRDEDNVTIRDGLRACPDSCKLSASLTKTREIVCPDETGALKLEVEGNKGNILLDWWHIEEEDEQLYEQNDLEAGLYTVTVFDLNDSIGCNRSASLRLTEPHKAKISSTLDKICPGYPVILTSSHPASADIEWSTGETTRSITVETAGTYTLTVNGAACNELADTLTLENGTDCPDTINPFCDPPIFPIVEVGDSCYANLVMLANRNAQQQYEYYIEDVKNQFREDYIDKCLSSFEKFRMKYEDKEHHYSLYYYDQAGNLVRTVPPAGVNPIRDTDSLQQIKNDRKNGTRRIYTNHTLYTTYTYNSLNQLVAESVPDHETMDIYESGQKVNGLDKEGLTVSKTQFTGNGNGFMTAYEEGTGEGYIYYTEDNGENWSKLSKIGTNNLNDVQIFSTGEAYACGEKGMFVRSENSGQDWLITPVGTGNTLKEVYFTDASNGYLYDENGNTWFTDDKGKTWNPLTAPDKLNEKIKGTLTDLQGTENPQKVYATSKNGTEGYIYKSINGGKSWIEVSKATVPNIRVASLYNETNGYAAGEDGIILRTTNRGASWTQVPSGLTGSIKDIHFAESSKGVILKDGQVLKTFNGGKDWESASSFTGLEAILIEGQRGYAVGGNTIYKTTSAGLTWSALAQVTSLTGDLSSVSFTADTVYAGNTQGDIVAVTHLGNTGINQRFIQTNSTAPLPDGTVKGLFFINEDKAVALVDESLYYTENAYRVDPQTETTNWSQVTGTFVSLERAGNTLYALSSDRSIHTSTDAVTWTELSSPVTSSVPSGFAISGTTTIITGEEVLVKNNSLNWEPTQTEVGLVPLNGIKVEAGVGYATGVDGRVYKTENDGATWTLLQTGNREENKDIWFNGTKVLTIGNSGHRNISTSGGTNWSSGNIGTTLNMEALTYAEGYWYATGEEGRIMRSPNSTSWTNLSSGTGDNLRALDFAGSTGIGAGENGKIVVSTGGVIWECVTNVDPLVLYASDMPTENTGYSVGKNGTAVKTTTAGTTWSALNSGTTSDLYAVDFTTENNGIIAGANGTLRRTENGGEDNFGASVVNNGPSGINFKDVYFFNSTTGYAVGDEYILKTTDGGETWNLEKQVLAGQQLNAVYFTDQYFGFAVGENMASEGVAWKAEWDGSKIEWREITEDIPAVALNDVYFTDYVTGYIIGDNGTVLKTVEKGETWSLQTTINSTENLQSITSSGENTFWFSGEGKDVVKLTDETDQYTSKFWYDELGRKVVDQTSRQFNRPQPTYSYTVYDSLNRIVEVGEVTHPSSVSSITRNGHPTQIKSEHYINWLESDGSVRSHITNTVYDTAFYEVPDLVQKNLRTRVAAKVFRAVAGEDFNWATHYSYDVHGNAETVVHDIPSLEELGQRYKRLEYEYDLVTTNTNKVSYQEGQPDQVFYKMEYDADNRITHIYTSTNNMDWDLDVKSFYYKHGPIARMELGEEKVQGLDYAYTIHGWLKGINSGTLQSSRDMGKDGAEGVNSRFAPDETGLVLGYYPGDYNAINTPPSGLHFAPQYSGDILKNTPELYNASITSSVTAIKHYMPEGEDPNVQSYTYDQDYRLKKATTYKGDISEFNSFANAQASPDYSVALTYDENGNILSLKRNAHVNVTASGDGMDDLEYIYENKGRDYERNTNKLKAVIDHRDTTGVEALRGLEDVKPGQQYDPSSPENDNYTYDEEGNLTSDKQEEIREIVWSPYGRPLQIIREAGSTRPDFEFMYDVDQQRILKIEKPRDENGLLPQSQWSYSYYIRDAVGNVIAIYNKQYLESEVNYKEIFSLDEQNIYSMERVGSMERDVVLAERDFTAEVGQEGAFENEVTLDKTVYNTVNEKHLAHYTGQKTYELTNHLGSVLTAISDRKLPASEAGIMEGFIAEVQSANDYYPFGMIMPGRKDNDSENYRYGYSGAERDDNIKGSGNSYDFNNRIYDPRLGRWWSLDPMADKFAKYSPYNYAMNNPILLVDPEGGSPILPKSWYKGSGAWMNPFVAGFIDGMAENITGFWDAAEFAYDISSDANFRAELVESITYLYENPDQLLKIVADEYATKIRNIMEGGEQGQYDLGTLSAEAVSMLVGGGGVAKLVGKVKLLKKAGVVKKAQKVTKSSPCGCFTKETAVLTDSGYVDVKDIKVGDIVLSYNLKTDTVELKPVTDVFTVYRDTLYKISVGEEVLQTTSDHPFYVNGEWVEAGDLEVGDTLRLESGALETISSIDYEKGNFTVYNFTVYDNHTYFVEGSGVLVHNSGPCDMGKKGTARFAQLNNKLKAFKNVKGNKTVSGVLKEGEADFLGKKWVGEGYTSTTTKKGTKIYISKDGKRVYRAPSDKNSSYSKTGRQANFEQRVKNPETGGWERTSNAHVDVKK